MIKKLCIKETIPSNFDEIHEYYTMRGYRVLGMGYKEVGN